VEGEGGAGGDGGGTNTGRYSYKFFFYRDVSHFGQIPKRDFFYLKISPNSRLRLNFYWEFVKNLWLPALLPFPTPFSDGLEAPSPWRVFSRPSNWPCHVGWKVGNEHGAHGSE